MARVSAILKALSVAYRRDWTAFQSLAGNNFFLATVFFLGKAGSFIYLILGLVLLFPLSTDPLRKIPASRLALWPLEPREHRMLRLLSPWINPLTWVIAGLAIWTVGRTMTFGLWGLVAGIFAAGFLLSDLPFAPAQGLWRRVPNLPGPLNQLVRKNLREILSTLDFYCALILSLSAIGFRVARVAMPTVAIPTEAYMGMTLLVVLALSSYAQCLFGLDGEGGLSRYRLLPLRGWRLLAAKDAAFLLVALALTLPLAPLVGAGAACVALAVGHSPSVHRPRTQTRWRFSTGASIMNGIVQIVLMAMAASTIVANPLVVLVCVAGWLVSLWWYGRELEKSPGKVSA
jgi:hypothetical protein